MDTTDNNEPIKTDAANAAPATPTTDVATASASTEAKTDPTTSAVKPVASAPRRNNTTLVAIVMAIVVLLGLSGIAAMTYLKTQDAVKPQSATPTQATEPDNSVSEADLEATATDIDKTMGELDDSKDFGENSLSDGTLGLQ